MDIKMLSPAVLDFVIVSCIVLGAVSLVNHFFTNLNMQSSADKFVKVMKFGWNYEITVTDHYE